MIEIAIDTDRFADTLTRILAAVANANPVMGQISHIMWDAVEENFAQEGRPHWLGLPIRELEPGSVKTLFNTRLSREAFSVFALEFHTAWVERALEPGAFSQPVDPSTLIAGDPTSGLDAIFAAYGAQVDETTPDLDSVAVGLHLDPTKTSSQNEAQNTGVPNAQAVANLQSSTQES